MRGATIAIIIAGVVVAIGLVLWLSKDTSIAEAAALGCPPNFALQGNQCVKIPGTPEPGGAASPAKLYLLARSGNQAIRDWLYANRIPWPEKNVPKEALCPNQWELASDGSCRLPGHVCSPASFTADDVAGRRDWSRKCTVPWDFVGAPRDSLCPPSFSPSAAGNCQYNNGSHPASPAYFWPLANETVYANWAREQLIPWPFYGVDDNQICPTGWQTAIIPNKGVACVKPGVAHRAAPFFASTYAHNDQGKIDWARQNWVDWQRYGVEFKGQCPDNYKISDTLPTDNSKGLVCESLTPDSQSPLYTAEIVDKAATAHDQCLPWSSQGYPACRLCPPGWRCIRTGDPAPKGKRGYCEKIDAPNTPPSPALLQNFDDAQKQAWAKANSVYWPPCPSPPSLSPSLTPTTSIM